MNAADLPLLAGIPTWHTLIPELSEEHMRDAERSGELRSLRHGRRILISRAALLDWIGEPQPTTSETAGTVVELKDARR
jgi:hypothetical protein